MEDRSETAVVHRATRSALSLVVALAGWLGCTPDRPAEHPRNVVVEVGRQAATDVHLHEKHSSALIAWRQDGVRGRVLVHLDARVDLDWLPDETVARIAASHPADLTDLEMEPYSLEEAVLERFGTENFIYPAARLGIVKEMVWVVPDGTLVDPSSMRRLVADVLVGRMQMVTEEEAASFHNEGRRIRGTLLGLPITICVLADLPELPETVLLDIDVNYFTVPSALSTRVDANPWIEPRAVIEGLNRRGTRTDLITLSLSTIGGFVPPESRWLARELQERLREPERPEGEWEELRLAAHKAEVERDLGEAVDLYRQLVLLRDDDATLWYALGRALEAARHPSEASRARAQAERLDPLLTRADLFEGDRQWLNGMCAAAVPCYDRYLERFPRDDFTPYARRRRAGCLVQLHRTDEALAEFRRVVEIAPRHADSRVDLGLLLRDQGDFGGAVEHLRAARRILPEVASYAMALGSTYLLQGRTKEGIAELEDAVARRPCYVQARARLATALYQEGRFDEAARHLQIALALQPANPRFRILAAQLRRHGARMEAEGSH